MLIFMLNVVGDRVTANACDDVSRAGYITFRSESSFFHPVRQSAWHLAPVSCNGVDIKLYLLYMTRHQFFPSRNDYQSVVKHPEVIRKCTSHVFRDCKLYLKITVWSATWQIRQQLANRLTASISSLYVAARKRISLEPALWATSLQPHSSYLLESMKAFNNDLSNQDETPAK